MCTSSGERSALTVIARLRGCEPERLLGELRRGRRGAAIGRERRGPLDDRGDIRVRSGRRERKVAGALHRIIDDIGDPSVNAAAGLAEVAVENG